MSPQPADGASQQQPPSPPPDTPQPTGAQEQPPTPSFARRRSRMWQQLGSNDLDVTNTEDNARLAERVATVEHTLSESGPLTRDELRERAGAGDWEPTVWARVLRVGSREDRIVYRGGRYFADYESADAAARERRRHG